MEKNKTFYSTFGSAHYPQGLNYYVKVHAPSYILARKEMFKRFGDKWAFMYTSAERAGVDEFSLQHIPEPELYYSK